MRVEAGAVSNIPLPHQNPVLCHSPRYGELYKFAYLADYHLCPDGSPADEQVDLESAAGIQLLSSIAEAIHEGNALLDRL